MNSSNTLVGEACWDQIITRSVLKEDWDPHFYFLFLLAASHISLSVLSEIAGTKNERSFSTRLRMLLDALLQLPGAFVKKFAGGTGGTLIQIKGDGDKCDMRGKARQRQLNTDKWGRLTLRKWQEQSCHYHASLLLEAIRMPCLRAIKSLNLNRIRCFFSGKKKNIRGTVVKRCCNAFLPRTAGT